MEQPEDHDKLADHLEQEGDEMQKRSADLGNEISDVRDDWQRKRADEAVPGAPPPEADGSEDSEDSRDPGDSRDAGDPTKSEDPRESEESEG